MRAARRPASRQPPAPRRRRGPSWRRAPPRARLRCRLGTPRRCSGGLRAPHWSGPRRQKPQRLRECPGRGWPSVLHFQKARWAAGRRQPSKQLLTRPLQRQSCHRCRRARLLVLAGPHWPQHHLIFHQRRPHSLQPCGSRQVLLLLHRAAPVRPCMPQPKQSPQQAQLARCCPTPHALLFVQ